MSWRFTYEVWCLIAGVREAPDEVYLGRNWVHVGIRHEVVWRHAVQHKHHRWHLDGRQIGQYRLGGALIKGSHVPAGPQVQRVGEARTVTDPLHLDEQVDRHHPAIASVDLAQRRGSHISSQTASTGAATLPLAKVQPASAQGLG